MNTLSEGVTIFAGKPKTCKSRWAMSFIERTQGAVLYIDLEQKVDQYVFSGPPKDRLDASVIWTIEQDKE